MFTIPSKAGSYFLTCACKRKHRPPRGHLASLILGQHAPLKADRIVLRVIGVVCQSRLLCCIHRMASKPAPHLRAERFDDVGIALGESA